MPFVLPSAPKIEAAGGIIRDGLVGRWPLQEGTGGTALDDSGNGNDGALTNYDLGVCWVAGPGVGGLTVALEADANTEFVDLGVPAILLPTDALTVCIWAKWNQITSGHVFGGHVSSNRGYGFWNGTRGLLGDDTTDYYNNLVGPSRSVGPWYHFALTFDGDWGRLYRNGGQVDSHNKTTTISYTNVAMIKIGGRSDRTNEGMIGAYADARVYDRALTPAEIAQIYAGTG